MADILNLFPTPIGMYNFNTDFNEEEIEFISNQETLDNFYNKNSKNKNILENVKLARVKKFIVESYTDFFNTVYCPKNDDVQLYLTQSWVNYTNINEKHHVHYHSNSMISGVLYFNVEPEKDRIYFYKDDNQNLISINSKDYNLWNSTSWWFETRVGQLILFPSYLRHGVEPVETETTRISLSFNTFLKGSFGNEDTLTFLKLE